MPGGTRTSADLANQALSKLGVLSSGQPTDPEDLSIVTNNLDAIFRLCSQLNVCYIPDPGNIPGEWFMMLADIVAGQLATNFNHTGQKLRDLIEIGLGGTQQVPIGAGAAALALKEIRRLKPTYEPLRAP